MRERQRAHELGVSGILDVVDLEPLQRRQVHERLVAVELQRDCAGPLSEAVDDLDVVAGEDLLQRIRLAARGARHEAERKHDGRYYGESLFCTSAVPLAQWSSPPRFDGSASDPARKP